MLVSRIITIALVASITTTLAAQQGGAGSVGAVAGTVRDSATGMAPGRTSVCALLRKGPAAFAYPCAPVDSAGGYRLDSIPVGALELSVLCSTARGPSKRLAFDSVMIGEDDVTRRNWVVPTAGCDKRPVRQVSGVFRGHYTPGFESSDFVPCPGEGWFVASDTLGVGAFGSHRAWVEGLARVRETVEWPDAPRDDYDNPRYYVRWKGTAIGPGNYGHMGGAPFLFRVDSILELRAPDSSDCR
jgi:hypothetical protein